MYPWILVVAELVFLAVFGVVLWVLVALLRKKLPSNHPLQAKLARFDEPGFAAKFAELLLAVSIAVALITVTLVYS